MPTEHNIRRAWDFLVKRAGDGQSFSIADLTAASAWSPGSTKIYISKKLGELIRKEGQQLYARPEVLRVRYEEFADLFGQKRRLFADYIPHSTPNVLVYEFFMPLTREDRLREALDNLFYEDAIKQRIKEIGFVLIREALDLPDTVSDDEVVEHVTKFMNSTIGGYSLSVVSGRFRAGNLATREIVGKRTPSEGLYLVDETTAVVRFILPVNLRKTSGQGELSEIAPTLEATLELAAQMRWLFLEFFAKALTRVVRQEDEIWLLETGMSNGLHVWKRSNE